MSAYRVSDDKNEGWRCMMSLMRRDYRDPFFDIDRRTNDMLMRMRSMMDNSLMPFESDLPANPLANTLEIDMTSDENNVIVRAALPGFKEDDVEVDVRGNVLTISAESRAERDDSGENWHIREMRYGKFTRSVLLPEEVTSEKADASLENGILTVKLPKSKPSPIQKIAVKARNLLKGDDHKGS